MALRDYAPSFITKFIRMDFAAPEVEYVSAGDKVAVVCSDFPDVVAEGFLVRWSDTGDDYALISLWYWDCWANAGEGEYRHMLTWEHIDNFRCLEDYLADGHAVETAIIYK